MTYSVTSDFRQEFEREATAWLRRRFLWYTGIMGGIILLGLLIAVGSVFAIPASIRGSVLIAIGIGSISPAMLLGCFVYVFRHPGEVRRERLVFLVSAFIVVNGVLEVPEALFGRHVAIQLTSEDGAVVNVLGPDGELIPAEEGSGAEGGASAPSEAPEPLVPVENPDSPSQNTGDDGDAWSWLLSNVAVGQWLQTLFISHLLASLFIPWRPREAIKPLVPLTVMFLPLLWFASEISVAGKLAYTGVTLLAGAPGVLYSWWRHGRFHQRFHYKALRGRYGEMKRELTDARRIHEALFPAPILSGPVRVDYAYEPMRQIGGDFLLVMRNGVESEAEGALSVVIIDVTGHGIPAALTVNRLHGELERLFAEAPNMDPGEALVALNRYVHLTLASHGVYATAICFRIDSVNHTLEYASGGHPPPFLRTADGRIERLDSTAMMLGATGPDEFEPEPVTCRFVAGDTLIAYTDGATEARGQGGRMLTVDGLQAHLASIEPRAVAQGGWAGALLERVERFRDGPAEDDTLVIEIFTPVA